MNLSNEEKTVLRTSAGDFPLNQYCLRVAEREWRFLHVSSVLSTEEESKFLLELSDRLPYGVTLWTASIALAHEIAFRSDEFRDSRVLELGAGTGMPGIVAATHGAGVVQTDRNELAMSVGKRNIKLNRIETIEQRIVDWTNWNDGEKYDWIIASDVLYGEEMHAHLRRIFESNLAPHGRILLSDPFRLTSFKLLEVMEADGWSIKISKWNIGEALTSRPIGVFELSVPLPVK